MIETGHLSHPKCMYYSCMYCSKDTSSAPLVSGLGVPHLHIHAAQDTQSHTVTHKQTNRHTPTAPYRPEEGLLSSQYLDSGGRVFGKVE